MISYLPMQDNNIKLFAQHNPKHCFPRSVSKPLHSLGVLVHALGGSGHAGQHCPVMQLQLWSQIQRNGDCLPVTIYRAWQNDVFILL